MRGLTARETKNILELAEAMVDPGEGSPELSIKLLEASTMIKTWGRMASMSSGLGFAKVSLGGGSSGDPEMTVERFDEITRIIHSQPRHYRIALIRVYQNGKNITQLAKELGLPRPRVEGWVWHGLHRLDAALNTVIRVTEKTR